MLLERVDRERHEIALILSPKDCDDLAFACSLASIQATDPKSGWCDEFSAERLRLLSTLFLVSFEAIKVSKKASFGVD